MSSTGTGTTLPAALRHLADYTAATMGATAAEITRATHRSATDALARAAAGEWTPLHATARALAWWTVQTDRRTPDWHTPNEIVFSTPYAHLRDLTRPGHHDDDVVPTLVLPPQAGHSSHIVDYSAEQSQVGAI